MKKIIIYIFLLLNFTSLYCFGISVSFPDIRNINTLPTLNIIGSINVSGLIRASGDIIASGNIILSSDSYAQYCVTDNALAFIPTQQYTTYNVGITDTILKNVTYSNGVFTILKAGLYMVAYTGCINKQVGADDISGGVSLISLGSDPDPCAKFRHDTATTGFNTFGGKVLLHVLTANERICFKLKNISSNTRSITLKHFSLIIERRDTD